MDKQKLGRTGVDVSRIGLGCATFVREIEQALEAMDAVKRSGLTRFIGCSNFNGAQTRASAPWLDAVEAVCNLANREAEEDLLPFCARENLGFLAYSPLAAGFLTGKYSGD